MEQLRQQNTQAKNLNKLLGAENIPLEQKRYCLLDITN